MKVDIGQLSKLYYSIGEVSELFDVNRSLLRYWESEFKQLQPRKKERGSRLYTKEDIAVINKIYDLLKVKGFTIEGARKALSRPANLTRPGNETNERAKKKIESALNRLRDIRKGLK